MPGSQQNNGTGEDPADVRFGEILNDLLERKTRGEFISKDELRARHPEFASELADALEVAEWVRPSQDNIEQLIARGMLTRSSDPAYPAQLGPYKIAGPIGHGGMGVVLKAYEPVLDRHVALKVLRHELAADPLMVRRFTREATAAARLQHTNVVTVYSVGENNGTHFIVMECVSGPSLAEVIRGTGPLPAEQCRVLFRQILSGLAAAHQAGLIHRDIKPSNILLAGWAMSPESGVLSLESGGAGPEAETSRSLEHARISAQAKASGSLRSPDSDLQTPDSGLRTPDSRLIVKLADFGLARVIDAHTRITLPQALFGTPQYMSPEQARGDENVDHRTDLYSAGVVLYEMLTGRTPFKADTPSAVIHQILHLDPPDPRTFNMSVDRPLASLALQLMGKQAQDRFESASATIRALEAGKAVRFPRPRRFRRRLIVTGAAFLGLVAATALITVLRQGTHNSRLETPRAGPISAVDVDMVDGTHTRTIRARYGDDTTWRSLYTAPKEAGHVVEPQLINLDGEGDRCVVFGTSLPVDGHCVFALNGDGTERWRLNLSDSRQWPDCAPPGFWNCLALTAGDIDGQPGDELVVAASDHQEYPTRISIVDPRTRRILSEFWHFGDIDPAPGSLRIIPRFFDRKRPAIIAWGSNNKLDGFEKEQVGDDPWVTGWDVVRVVMILDPQDMEGIGPPRSRRFPDLPVARPYAYAFVDAPADGNKGYRTRGQRERRMPGPEEVAFITNLGVGAYPESEASWPRLSAGVTSGNPAMNTSLHLDRHLNLLGVVAQHYDEGLDEYWGARWRPIVREGRYLSD